MNKKRKKVPIDAQLEKLAKTTEPDFDVNTILSELSKTLFDIDKASMVILQLISKQGPLNQVQVSDYGFKKSHYITRDVVRYRLQNMKNHSNLIKSNFIIQQAGKKIGNIKGKRESNYHLLFKGFLASLSKTDFDDCYLVKKYIDFIPEWTEQYNLRKISLQLIKFDLALFMVKYVMIGSKFNEQVDIDTHRDSLNYEDPLMNPNFTPQTKNMKYDFILFEIRYWYHVYSQVLKKIMERIIDDKIDKDKVEKIHAYVSYWYQWFFRSQFNSTPFSPQEIPNEIVSQMIPVGRTIGVGGVNVTAKLILKKIGLKQKLEFDEEPIFFD